MLHKCSKQPKLALDLVDRGITMAGGGSQLRNLDKLISRVTGLPVTIADNPLLGVVLGAGKVLDEFDFFRDAPVNQIPLKEG